jgi:signal transduction histidine kinase
MSTLTGQGLHPVLRGFPGAVLALDRAGTVLESNGCLERLLERGLAGQPFARMLDAASRRKLEAILSREPRPGEAPEAASPWELMMEGRDTLHHRSFYPLWDDGGERLWLVECPRDPRFDSLYEELAAVNSEQANTQRQLAKEKARLARALAELERELTENERLSRALQGQNEEMEAQNEELLAMTEELHAGQDQLLATNQQLERRTRELQIALNARNRFYAAMNHELRTPINAVMGYNDLLLAEVYGMLSEQQELAVERSQRAARHLRELVDDVLDLSRLELGKAELSPQEVDAAELVDDMLETLRPVAADAGAEMRRVEGPPVHLVTDARRLRQIVLNLLSNAIKYGGGAPVWARVARGADGGLVLEVTDGGPGIPQEDLGRIFDEFVQLAREDNTEPSGRDGTGLGLSIARRMAHALGGTLEAASTLGVGSTFRLTLPPAPPRPAGRANDNPRP